MRTFFLLALVASTACARTGVRTMCMTMPGGQIACRTRDFDEENRQKAEQQHAIRLNACVEGRSQTNPSESFGEARDRCEVSIAAQMAAADSN